MSFWNNPENTPIKVLLAVVLIMGAGYFVFTFVHSDALGDKGQVIAGIPNAPSGTAVLGSAVSAPAGTTLFPSLNVGGTPTGSLASAVKSLFVQGVSFFVGDVGVRGQIGVTQPDGSTVAPSAVGADTIYVQGVPVCLKDGTDCPAAATPSTPTSSTAAITALGESHFGNPSYTDPDPGVAYAIKSTSLATDNLYSGNEAHFGIGSGYIDPAPGVAAAIKANSIATGKLVVDGEVPIMRINPACFEGSTEWNDPFPLPVPGSVLGKIVLGPVAATISIAATLLKGVGLLVNNLLDAVTGGGTNWNDNILKSSILLTTSSGCTNKYGTYYSNSDYGIFGFVLPGIPPQGSPASTSNAYAVLGTAGH